MAICRTWVGAGTLLLLASSKLWAACQVPQPRLVCAEAAHSQAVVVARLEAKRTIPSDSDADLNVYSLKVGRLLRGQAPESLTVDEPNDSGRAAFDWNVGQQYVLFLSHSSQEHAWMLDGCGNSGPLNKSVQVLKDVEGMNQSDQKPLIQGMVSTDSWTTGIPNVPVTVSGQTKTFRARTEADGRFQLRVPPGSYVVTAGGNPSSFPPAPFSYENPGKLNLEAGTCAQVQFNGRQP